MVIAVDIDNVLFDFIGSFVDYSNAHEGYSIDKKEIKSNVLWPYFNTTREGHWDIFYKYYRTTYHKDAEPISGALEALTALSKSHEIIAITGRPQTVSKETEEWLEAKLPGLIGKVIYTNTNLPEDHPERRTKSVCCLDHKADILIDDDHFFANECAEQGITTIYFKTPYNENDKKHGSLLIAEDWEHVVAIIESITEDQVAYNKDKTKQS